jgi:flagellar biosynthesis protein FlhF
VHIKRFEAATMEEALAQVRATLGPDALILSSRTLRKGRSAFGLLTRPVVEVQAALERGALPVPGGVAAAWTGDGAEELDERGGRDARAFDAASEGAQGARGTSASDPTVAALVAELRHERALLRRRESFEEEMRSELRGLRAAMGRFGSGSLRDGEGDRVTSSLAQAGLDWIHARSLVEEWQARRAEGAERSLERVLLERIDARLAPPRVDAEKRIRVLVGAPGSGKTTSLAKLAGRSEEGEREVSLVSLDPYRIGARDQLRAYAHLLEAPYSELAHPDGLAEVARRHPDHAILVDTAGRSVGEGERLATLDGLREKLARETSIELVVDATARREVARAQIARFAPLRPDRLILTRLDECDGLAPVLNLLLDEPCPPLCWLGTGQRVPEDLEIAEPGRFAASILGRAA